MLHTSTLNADIYKVSWNLRAQGRCARPGIGCDAGIRKKRRGAASPCVLVFS